MKLVLLALVLSVGVACELVCAGSHSNSLAWRHFKRQHGKVYATQEEEARRFAIFMANKKLIESHNANASRTFDMGLNHMADWTDDERAFLNGVKLTDGPLDVISDEELAEIIGTDALVPDEVDWRKVKGRVGVVKNQGFCGSCWAFATTGVLEGQQLPQNMSSLVSLSEGELVDCSTSNHGCSGGEPALALDDLANKIGGIESRQDYPYFDSNEKCTVDKNKFLPLKIKGYKMLPKGDEKTLKQVVANYGPVSVLFEATVYFHFYKSGVYDDDMCKLKQLNHAVLVVGYGKDSEKGDYWIIKNSWGKKWGEQGYFRFRAGTDMCGIADASTIAIFK